MKRRGFSIAAVASSAIEREAIHRQWIYLIGSIGQFSVRHLLRAAYAMRPIVRLGFDLRELARMELRRRHRLEVANDV